MIAFKFLRSGGLARFSGTRWPAPGEWVETSGPLETCVNGVHACPRGALAYWFDEELWTVDLDDEILDEVTVLVARRGRLVARVGGWPEVSPELAWACAERARALAERASGDARLEALAEEAAESAALTSSLDEAVMAAYIAAVAAEALKPGGFEAERAWQSRRLAELLGC